MALLSPHWSNKRVFFSWSVFFCTHNDVLLYFFARRRSGCSRKTFYKLFFYRVSRYFRCVCFSHTSRHRKLFLFFFCIPVFLLFFSVLSFWSVERVYVGIASRLSFVISVVLFSLTTLDSTFLNIFSPFFSFFFFFKSYVFRSTSKWRSFLVSFLGHLLFYVSLLTQLNTEAFL